MSLLSFKNTLNRTSWLNFSACHKCIALLNPHSYESGQEIAELWAATQQTGDLIQLLTSVLPTNVCLTLVLLYTLS